MGEILSEIERRSKARVLIVESNEALARVVQHSLKDERIESQWIPATSVRHSLKTWKPQLLLIGDDLDGLCGIGLCAQVRDKTLAPVLILTECEAAGHHVRAFNSGADDVIMRPICPPVFLARVMGHLRRAYRYNAPHTKPAKVQPTLTPRPTPESKAALLMSQQMPEISADMNVKAWFKCGNCQYMGPKSQFVKLDERLTGVRACPVCGDAVEMTEKPHKTIVFK